MKLRSRCKTQIRASDFNYSKQSLSEKAIEISEINGFQILLRVDRRSLTLKTCRESPPPSSPPPPLLLLRQSPKTVAAILLTMSIKLLKIRALTWPLFGNGMA
ncbi:hypothetical protein Ancab_010721 [Ancistrocladus abbreviatus]